MDRVAVTLSRSMLAASLACAACHSKTPTTFRDAGGPSAPLPTASLQVPTDRLTGLEITAPSKESVTLSNAKGRWDIVSPFPFPANQPAVESMTAVLAEIEILRHVAERPEPRHRLSAETGVVVTPLTRNGASQAFRVGASIDEETYVQRLGEDAVYAVRGSCRRIFDLSLEQLRTPVITSLDVANIDGITYANRFGELTLRADPNDAKRFVESTPSIRNFNSDRASKNVAVLAKLFAKSFVDAPVDQPSTGLYEKDTARVTVTFRTGLAPLITYIGTRTQDGRLHLRTSASEQIYLVSAHLSSSLIPQSKHFERSDEELAEIRQQSTARAAQPQNATSAHSPDHQHETSLPTQVPEEMMGQLRDLAREQRD